MIFNILPLLCLILCFFNLFILIDESRQVTYNREEKNYNLTNSTFSFCLSINELIEQTNLLKKNEIYTPKQMIDKVANELLMGNQNNLILNSSSIRMNYVCIDFIEYKFDQIFPNISHFAFKLLINPSIKIKIHFFENVYVHNRLKDSNFRLFILIKNIRFLPYPFETNCTLMFPNESDPNKSSDQKGRYSKVQCILDCYKSKMNSTFFNYQYYENVKLKLNQNETLFNKKCEEQCKSTDCYAKFFYKYLSFFKKNESLPKIELDNEVLITHPTLDTIDLATQFISLFALFFNISLYEIFNILIKILKEKFNRLFRSLELNRHIRFLLIDPMYVALTFCFILFSSIAFFLIQDYLKFDYLVKNYSLPAKDFMPYTIFICLPVQFAYLNRTEDRLADLDQLKLENEYLFKNKTFFEIENDTNFVFKNLIRKSYLKKGEIELDFQVKIENETIFKNENFEMNMKDRINLLARCVRIDMNIKEYKYENYFAFTQLILELNYFGFHIYYVDFKTKLSSFDTHIERKNVQRSERMIRLEHPYKSNCLNYSKVYGYCTEKDDCIDNCYNRWFYGNYSSISTKSVIYSSDLNESILSNTHFDFKEDQKIRNDCIEIHPNEDCEHLIFENNFENIEFFENKSSNNQLVLELYYHQVVTYEVKRLTSTMLFFNLLNFESILIGINANRIINTLINLIKRTLRIRRLKFFGFLITFLCFFGFFGHCFFIFNEILTSPLIRSEQYERIMNIELPNFMICVEADLSKIDKYEKLNGQYLEKLTSNVTFETIFDRITILDQNSSLLEVKIEELESVKDKIEKSYYSFTYNLKCFQFRSNISISESDLIKFDYIFFAKIHFKEQIYSNDCNCKKIYIAFYDKTKGSFDKLQSYYLRRDNYSGIKSSFAIQPVISEFDYADKFYYFNKPLALFKVDSHLNDDELYFQDLVSRFKNITNCSTQLKNLKQKNTELFSLKINDDLLEQYYLQIQTDIDNSPFISPNYNVNVFILNTLTQKQKIHEPEILIIPSLFKYKITVTNDSNYAKLLINMLNSLSFWLSLSVVDLADYILKFLCLVKKFYRLLLKFKRYLKPNKFLI